MIRSSPSLLLGRMLVPPHAKEECLKVGHLQCQNEIDISCRAGQFYVMVDRDRADDHARHVWSCPKQLPDFAALHCVEFDGHRTSIWKSLGLSSPAASRARG